MDVRLSAFLARQRSADIQPRERFCGLPKRGLALLLANAMFWQPLWAQAAEGIVVSAPATSLDRAGNGVPIVNIAAPNGSGLSHNRFSDYNVGRQGLILNNATGRTQATELGGIIVGNPNLKGTAANIILNEVNGANPSQLRGYTEVAGRRAHVIVANPHGISCDGCGFINTPRTTLSTGRPVIENGQLTRYQVDRGQVAIEGAGLNADNVDSFEIVTRSAKINAQIQARNLAIVAGRNDVDARTLSATVRADDNSAKPQLAIDSSALGGMYAGAIKLVGTEAGVGVKLDGNLIASGGDIQLDANGQLRMAQASAAEDVRIRAAGIEARGAVHAASQMHMDSRGDLVNRQSLSAAGQLQLSVSGQLNNQGGIEAGVRSDGSRSAEGDLKISAGSMDNRNQRAIASRDLTLATRDRLDNQSGTLSAGRDAQVKAATLDNRQQGKLLSAARMTLEGGQLINREHGQVTSQGALKATWAQLDNQAGELSSLDAIALSLGMLDNRGGRILATRGLTLVSQGSVDNRTGRIAGQATLDVSAQTLDNSQGGQISGNQAVTVNVGRLDQQGGRLTSATDLTLDVNHGHLNNRDGLIAARQLQLRQLADVDNRAGEISSQRAFGLTARNLDNTGGQLYSEQALTVRLDQLFSNLDGLVSGDGLNVQAMGLDNRRGVLTSDAGLVLVSREAIDNQQGEISSAGTSQVRAANLDSRKGMVTGSDGLQLVIDQALDNRQGVLAAGKALTLSAISLDNREQGKVLSDGSLMAKVSGLLDNQAQGLFSGQGTTQIDAGQMDNRGGRLTGKALLTLRGTHWDNRGGKIDASGDLILAIDTLNNSDQGLISGQATIRYEGRALLNRLGLLGAVDNLYLQAEHLDNGDGRLSTGGDLDARIARVEQHGGKLMAQGNLTLRGGTLDNSQGGLVGAGKGMLLAVDNVDNRSGELSATHVLSLQGQRLDNSAGQMLGGTDLSLKVAQVINQAQGLLNAKGRLTLEGLGLDNQSGRLSGEQGVQLLLGQGLNNGKGLITSEGDLDITAASLDNTDAKLTTAGKLALVSLGSVLNQRGTIIAGDSLSLHSAGLDNRAGEIGAQGVIDLATGTLDNLDGGRLVGNDRLSVKAGQINNGNDSRLASEGELTLSATGLYQQGGQLFSKTALTLSLDHGQLINHGLINAPVLVLNELGAVDNQQGEISSAQGFSLTATGLDNRQGKLISSQALTLRIAQALDNAKGLVSANGLDLSATRLDNREGLVSSRGNLALAIVERLDNRQGTLVGDASSKVTANTLDNTQGTISSKGDSSIEASALVNAGGSLISLGQLQVKAAQLDNREKGLVGGNDAVTLEVGQLDNRGGEITGKAQLGLSGMQLDNSDGGLLVAGAGLTLAMQQVLNRNKGRLEAQTGLTLNGQTLDNDGGRLTSQQDMVITLAGQALNRLGLISAEGQLALIAQGLDNSTGSLSSAGALQLTTRGALLNKGGELLTDADLTLASASLYNSDLGVLASKGALSITTGQLDNNRLGSVSSNRTLDIHAGQLDNRDGGRLGSREALTASITGLDQQGGKLFSDTSVRLDLNQGHLDNRGGLVNAPLLLMDNLKSVDNRGGEISSAQAFTLAAEQLDNSNGRLLSNQALLLRVSQRLDNLKGLIAAQSLDGRAGVVDNSGGTLASLTQLDFVIDGKLSNRDSGLIEAKTLALASQGLDNQGGKLFGDTIRVDLAGADLDNGNGLIATAGPLTLDNLRKLANQNGEISTAQSLQLKASALDNRGGKLISEKILGLATGRIDNRGGLISGWQGLKVNAHSLDNRQQGTLSSRSGALEANVTDTLRNSDGGALVALKRLDVAAASLDNSAKGVLSSGAGQRLTISGVLDNHDGGLIDAGADLELETHALDNRAGSVVAQQDLRLAGTRLDNNGGSLAAQGGVNLNLLADLLNRQGKLASGRNLLIQHAGLIDNQGGQIASQGLLDVSAASFDNGWRGTLAASGTLTLASEGALSNGNDGLIYSQQGDLRLRAASLTNSDGTLQAQGGVSLDVTGNLDNQGGKVIAQTGALGLSAANIDNRGGALASLKDAFTARTTGVLRNGVDAKGQRGILQALRLDLQSASFDNRGGRIAALNGDALIRTGQLDNRDGGVSAGGLLKVTGTSLLNGGDARGEMVGQRIDLVFSGAVDNRQGIIESASTLNIGAASLDNQTGQLRALGATGKSQFAIGGLFDNRNGLVEIGNSDLTLGAGLLQNLGGKVLHVGTGTFDIDMANLTRAGGSLITRAGLTLAADSWTNGSAIQAGRLTVNVKNFTQTAGGQLLAFDSLVGNGSNWSNDGLIASDGNLNLNLSGTYSGDGRASSLGTLGVTAAQMNLGANASLTGVGNSTIQIAGLLSNQGRLTSAGDLIVNADSLNNLGTLGGNQLVRVSTGGLRNDRGLLYSGGDMQLYTGSLSNFYGDVYSLGELSVARDAAGNWADRLENISGSLESVGDMRLSAGEIDNKKEFFNVSGELVSGAIGMRITGRATGHFVLQEYYQSKLEQDSPASTISAGRDLLLNGGELNNSNSVITAQRDLTANFTTFNNVGSSFGSYQVLKSFNARGGNNFFTEMWRYNAANDPGYSMSTGNNQWSRGRLGNVRTWDSNWKEAVATPSLSRSPQNEYSVQVAWYNSWLWTKGLAFARVSPSYQQGIRTPLPAQVQNAKFFDERTIVQPGQVGAVNAVVQAGGRVQINATKNLTNSVVQEGMPVAGSAGKAFDPKLPSASGSTIINIHAQLPPDLARQQVNPLALGGFTLPTGQNGLFRLSDQAGSTHTAGAPGWSLGAASVATQHRQPVTPGVQLGALQAAQASSSSPASQQIAQVSHPAAQAVGDASSIEVLAPAGATLNNLIPQRHGGADSQQPTLVGNQGISGVPTQIPGITQLPDSQFIAAPHKYLIETNPALTDLKQFMSSDYLLDKLGYDPDQSWKRLGDGLYEQRLIQQAIVARTGQQFIDGQNSGEALFKYLMDNAIRSKDQLNLSMGVGLSAAQVAALTHDIVWMEQHVVNGEQVLVPVLYLAQANDRLAPNGALIAGQDVELIAGENLSNVGTLRASGNLSATAGKDLLNGGLIEAGERLNLLAGNNLINSAGGIIAGRDVSLTAINGDVINQRDQTRHAMNYAGITNQWDYLDSAARIEATNDLSVKAGQDVKNIGSVITSGGDLSISAGRDVSLLAVEQREGFYTGSQRNSSVKQHGATVAAGRDLNIDAGGDIAGVASRIEAGRDIAMAATGDLALISAADEAHSYSRSKKVTQSKDQVTQVSTSIKAGGDVSVVAGQDMTIVASQVRGSGDVDIDAARDLTIASEQDESASYYLKKSKGSFGRSSATQKESYHSTNVASVIEAGGDLTVNVSKTENGGLALDGGRDVSVIGSQLKAGGDLMVGATGDVAVLSGVEEHGEYSKKTKSGFLGLSKSGKSQLKTSASQVASELDAGNDIVLAAGNDLRLRASEANAGNDIDLRAGLLDSKGDINLVAANDTTYSRSEEYKKKVGLSVSSDLVIRSVSVASAKAAGQEARSSTSVASQVVAERDATLQAERDINLLGSGVNAGRNVTLNAGRDVNVAAAENHRDDQQWSKTTQVGLSFDSDDNGVSFFAGSEMEKAKARLRQQLAAASQLKAGQDLDVTAGRDFNQTGSDLIAGHDIKLGAGRDINIDAARETQVREQEHEYVSHGAGGSINHNFGNTKDAVSSAGKGENAVSKGSSTLQAIDSVNQFLAGPTADGKFGRSAQSSQQTSIDQGNRTSTLDAGNDITLDAGNDVTIKGGQLQAGRDIAIKGRDIDIDVAQGSVSQESQQSQSWGGVHGGTSGGFKLGIGASHGTASADSAQGNSTPSQLNAGRDVKLDASNDLNIIGSGVQAGRGIDLAAGNVLNIRAAQNDSSQEHNRRSGGGEVGITVGSEGLGIYASVNLGKGNLEREAQRHQEAYIYASDQLKFTSGKDTSIAGAQLRGDQVIGQVGGDLSVASAVDTGKVKGKEFDLSATVTVGPGAGVSGSVGYGQTSGKTEWVENQTRITGASKVDIRTQDHTQLDGALIAADNGNLKLDTGSLGYSDIAGKDKEHGYYLNVGGTFSNDSGSAQQDSSQVGKGEKGQNGWSVSGWEYEKDREQIVRATVGAGDITVRQDAETGQASTSGLNRDLDKAYAITRDKESRTDLYVTGSSLDDALNPQETLQQWSAGLLDYNKTAQKNFEQASTGLNATLNRLERVMGRQMPAGVGAVTSREFAEQTLEQLILSGKSRSQAMAMMADGDFQNRVLEQLSQFWNISPEHAEQVKGVVAQALEPIKAPTVVNLPPSEVAAARLTLLQENLRALSDINEFIEQNPDKAQAVAVVLALTQGPKGVIQAVAMSAAEQTPIGQELMARLQGMQDYVGQKIAEHMEGQGLRKDDSFDKYLMGGGSLVASIIGTGISAVKGGKAGADGPSREVKKGAERGNGGAKATATTGEVVATEATSANAQAALRAKLSGLQKAQETAAVTRTLPDGRIRYYTQEVPARTEGPTRGASFATEFDPKTGSTRQWMESYDHAGEVIRVHPKSINGQPVDAQHYPPTGAELKSWGQQ